MKTLITGAAGFVGSHVLLKHLKMKKDVLGLTRYPKVLPLSKINQNIDFPFVYADVTNFEEMKYIINHYEIDRVIHFAAEAIVGRAEKDPLMSAKINIFGTLNLLELAREFNFELAVQSTDKVYGDALLAQTDTQILPVDFYGHTKAAADSFVGFYKKKYNLKIALIRPCNIYGFDQNISRLIPSIIISCLNGKNPKIKKFPKDEFYPIRQFLYIETFVQFIMETLDFNLAVPYLLGTQHIYSTKEIANLILDSFPERKLDFFKSPSKMLEINKQSLERNVTDKTMQFGLKRTIKDYKDFFNYVD